MPHLPCVPGGGRHGYSSYPGYPPAAQAYPPAYPPTNAGYPPSNTGYPPGSTGYPPGQYGGQHHPERVGV